MAMYEGADLSAAREAMGLTISAASRHLSIPESTLEALERNRLETLPAECFTVGFLRSYCRFLELPAEAFVERYHESLAFSKSDNRSVGKRLRATISEIFAQKLPVMPSELVSWGAIVGLMISGWIAYSVVFRPHSAPQENRASAAIQDLRVPDNTRQAR